MVEGVTNYSFFFRRPIDPQGEEQVKAKFRGTETASEVAKMMTRWLPGEGISPRKVDNLLFSWSGGLGRLATGTIDVAVDAATGKPRPLRPLLQTVPGIKGIVTGEPGFGSESIERFYRELGRARTAKATLRYFAQRNMIESHSKELEDERANLLRSVAPALEATSRTINQLRKVRNDVLRDPLMDPAEKQRRLLELGREATAAAKKTLEFTRGASAPRIGTQTSRRSRRIR
jgi:hypothetical protein